MTIIAVRCRGSGSAPDQPLDKGRAVCPYCLHMQSVKHGVFKRHNLAARFRKAKAH
jgi:hypothetical protein